MSIKLVSSVAIALLTFICIYLDIDSHIFLYPDSFGYLFPAAKKIDGEGLNLIYGRPVGFPFFLSLLSFNFFEIQLRFFNLLFYYSLPIFLFFYYLKFLKEKNKYWTNFIGIFVLILFIFFYFSNLDAKQWFYYVAPEGFSSFLLGFSLLHFLILDKKNCNSKMFLSFFVLSSVYLILTKPAFLFFSLFILLAFCIKKLILNEFKLNNSFYFFIFFTIFILSVFISLNKFTVNKYDYDMSTRFSGGSMFCSNLDIIQNSPNATNKFINPDISPDFINHIDFLITHDDKSFYPLLGFNQDVCLYSQESIFQFLDNYYDRKETAVLLKKITFYSILENPMLFLKKIIKQYIYVFKNPWSDNVSESITINDSAMKTFNRSGHKSDFIDHFWNNHDWDSSLLISNPLKPFYLPNSLFIVVILINFLSYLILLFQSNKNKNLYSSQIKILLCDFLLPLGIFFTLILAVAMFGSFDVARYTHNHFPVVVLLLFFITLNTIKNFEKIKF